METLKEMFTIYKQEAGPEWAHELALIGMITVGACLILDYIMVAI